MPARRHRTAIPLHRMEPARNGLELHYIAAEDALDDDDDHIRHAHRDDHYIFFLQERGRTELLLDFAPGQLRGRMMGFILPGQVHHYRRHAMKSAGWFLAIAPAQIEAAYRAVFESKLLARQTVVLKSTEAPGRCLALAAELLQAPEQDPTGTIVHHLVNAFMGMAAAAFGAASGSAEGKPARRTAAITAAFRELVVQRFVQLKSPSDYAALLAISTAYLNEAVRAQTGFSPTYWIQQETVLEASRLLYHTDLTVKEIAYRTGFEDPAYFSRLFRKTAGETPLTFRSRYRESSSLIR